MNRNERTKKAKAAKADVEIDVRLRGETAKRILSLAAKNALPVNQFAQFAATAGIASVESRWK